MPASFQMLFEGFRLSDSFQDFSMMKTVTACDEYQALFHVACPPCREAVWHFDKRLYRNLKGFILNYTDLLGHSGEVTCLQTLVYSLLKEGNVVQIIFIKCLGHSRRIWALFQEILVPKHRKFELWDLLMTCTLHARIKTTIYTILKHNLLFHVLNDFCLELLC